jgi:hypothetical protein
LWIRLCQGRFHGLVQFHRPGCRTTRFSRVISRGSPGQHRSAGAGCRGTLGAYQQPANCTRPPGRPESALSSI